MKWFPETFRSRLALAIGAMAVCVGLPFYLYIAQVYGQQLVREREQALREARALEQAAARELQEWGCDAIKAGIFPGPRISAAAKYLSTHAALTDYFPSWIGAPVSGVGALTENTSQMLGEVRNQIKNGVDFVKIAASGESSILTPGGGSVPAFNADELKVIVQEAHRLGRRGIPCRAVRHRRGR